MIIKFGSKKHCVKKTLELKYSSPYEAWFFTNSDNRNIPIISKADSYDYVTCFKKHSVKRVPEPKYSSLYKAWLFRNCDNRNTPELKKEDPHDYVTRFKKHSVKRAPCKCDKNYAAWFERNCVSKSTGVLPAPFLKY